MRTIMYYVATTGYDKQEQERRLALMAPFVPDGYRVVFSAVRGGPEFLDRAEDFASAVDAVAADVGTIGPEDCDVLMMSGALDPGLPLARQLARVPVVGPGEASLYVASLVGLSTSIVTVDEHAVTAAQRFVDRTVVKPRIVSVRSMDTPVRTIVSDLEAGRAALLREVQAAIHEDGAEAIYLGAMTLPTLGLTEQLREKLQVPVYDPLRIAIRTAVEVIVSRFSDNNLTRES